MGWDKITLIGDEQVNFPERCPSCDAPKVDGVITLKKVKRYFLLLLKITKKISINWPHCEKCMRLNSWINFIKNIRFVVLIVSLAIFIAFILIIGSGVKSKSNDYMLVALMAIEIAFVLGGYIYSEVIIRKKAKEAGFVSHNFGIKISNIKKIFASKDHKMTFLIRDPSYVEEFVFVNMKTHTVFLNGEKVTF